jgi:hypothetical protein
MNPPRLIVRMENDLSALIDPTRSDDDILREIIETMSPEEVLDGAKWSLERLPGFCMANKTWEDDREPIAPGDHHYYDIRGRE